PAASGSQYQGRNESIWIKGDEALVVWGFEAPQMRCQKAE
ncbi:MAG: MliC family protein, partial [Xanthomonadales bacterium]|nr:MliC family protein [Xanthomonadales bacterium]